LHHKTVNIKMKYNELNRLLRRIGCYPVSGKQIAGHPAWYSPITGRYFPTSNHGSEEVKRGTLKNILRDSGLEL
jgi:predicted RNA binding protein YcfA (HicA-like mRNA interferase family)